MKEEKKSQQNVQEFSFSVTVCLSFTHTPTHTHTHTHTHTKTKKTIHMQAHVRAHTHTHMCTHTHTHTHAHTHVHTHAHTHTHTHAHTNTHVHTHTHTYTDPTGSGGLGKQVLNIGQFRHNLRSRGGWDKMSCNTDITTVLTYIAVWVGENVLQNKHNCFGLYTCRGWIICPGKMF